MATYNGNTDLSGIIFTVGDIIEFTYSGTMKDITLPICYALVECYGAQGGRGMSNGVLSAVTSVGYGGYTRGVLFCPDKQTKLYICVGNTGANASASSYTYATAGWNGGGTGGGDRDNDGGAAGGGASDIRLISGAWNNIDSLRSRIMVAAGGAGVAGFGANGGHGGGLEGLTNVTASIPADQISGYSFGIAQNGYNCTGKDGGGGGGSGGGYYGGRSYGDSAYSGSGGSSFISGMEGCNAIDENGNHTGKCVHYSGMLFRECSTEIGVRNSSGLVRITIVENYGKILINENLTIHGNTGRSYFKTIR